MGAYTSIYFYFHYKKREQKEEEKKKLAIRFNESLHTARRGRIAVCFGTRTRVDIRGGCFATPMISAPPVFDTYIQFTRVTRERLHALFAALGDTLCGFLLGREFLPCLVGLARQAHVFVNQRWASEGKRGAASSHMGRTTHRAPPRDMYTVYRRDSHFHKFENSGCTAGK